MHKKRYILYSIAMHTAFLCISYENAFLPRATDAIFSAPVLTQDTLLLLHKLVEQLEARGASDQELLQMLPKKNVTIPKDALCAEGPQAYGPSAANKKTVGDTEPSEDDDIDDDISVDGKEDKEDCDV